MVSLFFIRIHLKSKTIYSLKRLIFNPYVKFSLLLVGSSLDSAEDRVSTPDLI